MQIALIGLPGSGKTTVLNAVTGGAVEAASYGGVHSKPNIGIAKVRDSRLSKLSEIYTPGRIVPAEAAYVDFPVRAGGKGDSRGISGEYLNQLQRADILTVVARAFEDPAVPHVNGTVDAARDMETMCDELLLVDLQILERRIERLAEGSKGARAAERGAVDRETAMLARLMAGLESGTALRDQVVSNEERRLLQGYELLSAKPLVAVANIGEDQLEESGEVEARMGKAARGSAVHTAAICAALEMELARMDADDEAELRQLLGLSESGLDRMVRLAYEASSTITFFTAASNELRAWPLDRGTPAQKAAGKIHTDMERGFIRAEVVSYDDLAACGSEAAARRRGLLRSQGKSYPVADGDVVSFLFNV